MRSYHDDLVMSLSIACWVRDTALEIDKRDVAYKKAMVNGMYLNSTTMNTTIKGQDGHKKSFDEKYREEIKNAKDFVWIFRG